MNAIEKMERSFKEKLDSEKKSYMNTEQGLKEDIQVLQSIVEQREKDQIKAILEDNQRNAKDLENLSGKLEEIKVVQAEASKKLETKMRLQDNEHDKEMDLRETNIGNEIADLNILIDEKDSCPFLPFVLLWAFSSVGKVDYFSQPFLSV